MTAVEHPTTDTLRQVSLFAKCSVETLAHIAQALQPVEVGAGEVIFREGEPGDDMYVIASGHVRVVSDAESERVVFAHLGPGELFGEMALLGSEARSAAVVASTESRLWRLAKGAFEAIQQAHPEITVQLTQALGERVRLGNVRRFQNEAFTLLALTPERPEITIGRQPDCDVVINDPQVSAVHAKVKSIDGRWLIYDEGSATGTYVNRERVSVSELSDGDEILIGTNKVFLDGATVKGFATRDGVRIDAVDLARTLGGGRTILRDVSLSILPGEFVAVVGGSGAGKTSLLHALNGFAPGTSGKVLYNGAELYENQGLFRSVLGYVPQDDIVHGELTVERTLYYGAKLRLPKDTSSRELEERLEDVIRAVSLDAHRRTPVRRLSGGQRKRVSVALELLARPRALYLDEPTSGLDPALEGRMMALFRELTESGTTVLISTHVTQNLRMCDKVIWMVPGGRMAFFGSPAEALRHFGVQSYEEIYDLFEGEEAAERWVGAFTDSPAHRVNVRDRIESVPDADEQVERFAPAQAPPRRTADPLRQLFWLTVRYAEVLGRDTANLLLLLAQAPAIAAAALLLFDGEIFGATLADGGDAFRALMSMHVITASAIFLGASNAAREITKESAIYSRERLVNLGVIPYVLSKAAVLSGLCLLQAAALVAIFMIGIELPGDDWPLYGQMLAAIFLTELAGMSMGLLVSAVSANSDRAMAIVPVLLIPQLIFAGALVPLGRMLPPAEALAQLMISKWALQLAGHLTTLGERFGAQFPEVFAQPYQDQLDVVWWLPWVVLAAFAAAMLGATLVVQQRKGAG